MRGKREYTEAILSAMGGIKKGYFSYLKSLLKLSDEALELADRHNLDERRLRPIMALSPEYHVEVVRQMIDLNLTAKQVHELCEGDLHETSDEAKEKIPATALKIAKISEKITVTAPQDVARALIQQEGDLSMARARLHALRKLLAETEQYLGDE